KDERVDLARLDAGRDSPRPQPLDAVVALHRYRPTGCAVGERIEGDHIEGADHRAHRAGDAPGPVDQHDVVLGVASDCPGRANLLARRRVAVAALVGEGGARPRAGRNMDPFARRRQLERREGNLVGRRMLSRAGEFALETADAPLRVDEDSGHLLTSRERAARSSTPPSRGRWRPRTPGPAG